MVNCFNWLIGSRTTVNKGVMNMEGIVSGRRDIKGQAEMEMETNGHSFDRGVDRLTPIGSRSGRPPVRVIHEILETIQPAGDGQQVKEHINEDQFN